MTTIRARFTTPTITATPAALETLATAGIAPAAVLARHFAGEWGGQPDNAARNEEYPASGEGMLLSVFADVPGLVLQPHIMIWTDDGAASGHSGCVAPAPDGVVASATTVIAPPTLRAAPSAPATIAALPVR